MMKHAKQQMCLWLAALLVILSLAGCNVTDNSLSSGTDGGTGSTQGSELREDCAHADEANDGLCDLCGGDVVITVDLYGLNDLHGKFEDGDTQPGVDEMSTYLKWVMGKDEVSVLLASGDMWQGSAPSNMTRGAIITDWMSAMGFEAMSLGNHEFDWGEAAIEANAALAEFPLLAINVYDTETRQRVDYCAASVLIDRGSVQIGVVGAIGDCYSDIAPDKVEEVYFVTGRELTQLVKEESDRLREAGADLIVYLLHDGNGSGSSGSGSLVPDHRLAGYYDISLSDGYVDVVLEGHTHQRYATVDSKGVYHVQCGGENRGLSHVELDVNVANGRVHTNTAEVLATSTYTHLKDDPVVQKLLDKYADQIASAYEILGTNAHYRTSDELRQLVARLYAEEGLKLWGDEYDIVLGGGFLSVRNPYQLNAGEVDYAVLQSIFPFDNDLVLCSIKGGDLLSRFMQSTNSNYFVHLTPYGESIRDSIDPNGTYYIVVDSYTSPYAPNRLTEITRDTSGTYARDLLADFIRAGGLS